MITLRPYTSRFLRDQVRCKDEGFSFEGLSDVFCSLADFAPQVPEHVLMMKPG